MARTRKSNLADVREKFDVRADGGWDPWLKREGRAEIVQRKQWRSRKVGGEADSEPFGVSVAEKAKHAHFVCSGEDTKEALAFARGKPITLIDGGGLLGLVNECQRPGATRGFR